MLSRHLRIGPGVATAIGLIGAACNAPSATAANACPDNPIIGTWRVNIAKSQTPRPAGLAGRIVVIAPYGEDGITRVTINEQDPRAPGREEHFSVTFDGKMTTTKGGDPRLLRITRTDCHNYDVETRRELVFNRDGSVKQYIPGGEIQIRGHLTIAADGKTMTDSHKGLFGNQTEFEEILIYEKQ
jgi:hypothetical protein